MLANCDAMIARGILHPFRVARHIALFNSIFSGRLTVAEVAEDLQARADRQAHPIDTILLSDEDVCMRPDLSVLAEFRTHFDVKVILALRRQDLWLESWYLQNIKWQWNNGLAHCTLAEFLDRSEEFHWIRYDRLLQHLESLFGQENVLPYVYEKAQMPQGPVAAFCAQMGLGELEGLKPAPHVNSSYSPQVAEFVRQLPLDEAPNKVRARFEAVLQGVDRSFVKQNGPQSSLLLDHQTRLAVMQAAEAGNAAVARRYFARDALFFEPLPDPAAPLARMELPADPAALLRDFVAPMIRGLIRQQIEANSKT